MSDGTPERPGRAPLPHILVPWAASEQAYRGRTGGGRELIREISNRQGHARKLTDELEAAQDIARRRLARVDPEIAPDGFALSVESWSDDPVYNLAVERLDSSGAKVLTVTPGTDQTPDRAVVWFPFSAVPKFFAKIQQFATETTPRSGAPRNQALVANIAELRLAVLRDLWQEEEPFPDPGEVRWWEVWLARLPKEPEREPATVLRAVAGARGWRIAPGLLTFPENVIALVQTTGTELAELLTTNAIPSELHRPRVASEILGVEPFDQDEFAVDLAGRIRSADPDAAAVCVLDTGVMAGHPLLSASIDTSLSALDGVGPADLHGHGTKMAGLALFGDLDHDLLDDGLVSLRHRLESVKVLRRDHDTQNDPEAYPVITASATAAVEVGQARRRVFSMAVTVDDPAGSDGSPSSYSAAFDALAFGTDIDRSDDGIKLLGQPDPQAARLYVVSAGNVSPRDYAVDHLVACDLARIQNPAQAWNVLTVGAYTELVDLPKDPMYAGWQPVAIVGELSPFSRTSAAISRSWPIKPDIVLEGGNLMINASGRDIFTDPALGLVTTSLVSSQSQSLLTTANATSAATAQAARLAAVAMDRYPALWAETVRGLLVHAAEWTPAMQAQFTDAGNSKTARAQLLRRYGWGVPNEARVLDSAASAVTLIIQDQFQPFEPRSSGIAMRALRLHELPWPREQLRDLFAEKVRLRVTLSYFVEPNPSKRGWQGRYRYASHGLRFDVKRPTETLEDFRRRLSNMAAKEEGDDTPQPGRSTDDRWYIGSRFRNAGSLHADIWTGTGADLANSGYIGITPVGGWWKDNGRSDRTDLPIRYALLVSLRTDAVTADIYTPIAAQIGIPVPIET